jgi:hypothetical protein
MTDHAGIDLTRGELREVDFPEAQEPQEPTYKEPDHLKGEPEKRTKHSTDHQEDRCGERHQFRRAGIDSFSEKSGKYFEHLSVPYFASAAGMH